MITDAVLAQFQCYVAPRSAQDQSSGVVKLADELFATRALGASQLLIRAPMLMAVRKYVNNTAEADLYTGILLAHSLELGLFDRSSPNFHREIHRIMNELPPQDFAHEPGTLIEVLHIKLRYHGFGTRAWPLILLGLPSYLPHSCAPNVGYTTDMATREYCFCALRSVAAGARLTISFAHFPIDSYEKRNTHYRCGTCESCAMRRAPSLFYADYEAPLPTDHCWWCGIDKGTKPCAKCRCANYCSEKCRRANAATHVKICAKLATGSVRSRHAK